MLSFSGLMRFLFGFLFFELFFPYPFFAYATECGRLTRESLANCYKFDYVWFDLCCSFVFVDKKSVKQQLARSFFLHRLNRECGKKNEKMKH